MINKILTLSILCISLAGSLHLGASENRGSSESYIQPYDENPWYWMYRGEPLLLIGGSDDDNLFQWSEDKLNEHLDLLKSVGGNFLRNTLSSRDEGNELPYKQVNGRFEFSVLNEDYWDKLDFFLKETANRGIIVQLTLWDQHDFAATNWEKHFWNPANNNIGLEASGVYDDRAFVNAVKERNALVLPYQMKYVEQILSISLQYDHVLYNISNEGWAGLEWEVYWGTFIHKIAKKVGKRVYVTSMEHSPQLSVDAVLKHSEVFDYVEVSQNNNFSTGYRGRSHWQNLMDWRSEISDTVGPRPFMNEKIYGAPGGRSAYGSDRAAIKRFWRNIFAGCSSVRFHRPNGGLGLSEIAQKQIRSLRMLNNKFDIPNSYPAPERIQTSSQPESFCLQGKNGQIALYLVNGGQLSLSVDSNSIQIQSLDMIKGSWTNLSNAKSNNGSVQLELQKGKSHLLLIGPYSEN